MSVKISEGQYAVAMRKCHQNANVDLSGHAYVYTVSRVYTHHICIWVLVHVNVCMCNCAHTCGGQRTMECVFLHLDILHFLRQSQSLNLELTDWQG